MPKGLKSATCIIAVALLSSTPSFGQTPTALEGEPFLVNTYTTGGQGEPAIAIGPDGDFVVVWQSDGSDGDTSGGSIQGQRYASSGSPLGDPFQVNTYTTDEQASPSVAFSADGGFVVTWWSYGSDFGDDSDASIQAQEYLPNGDPLGEQFQVNTFTTDDQVYPSVAVHNDGDFVIVWASESSDNDTDGYSIRGQRFASGGDPFGESFQVNTGTTGNQTKPSIALEAEGGFVVVWQSTAGPQRNIYGQLFTSHGAPLGSQFQVNTVTGDFQRDPVVARHPGGDFVVAWKTGIVSTGNIQGRRFAAGGDPLGDQFLVSADTSGQQIDPSIAMDADGDFVVTWAPGFFFIEGQRFASNGDPIGDQFQINTYTTFSRESPSVAMTSNGDFVVAWQSYNYDNGDTSYLSIQAQRVRVTADVGDRVFLDTDFDGRQDASEPGAPGVSVHLRDDLGDLLASTTTDAQGSFLFQPKIAIQGVADSFFLEFEAPLFGIFTARNVGLDDTLDSDADPATGETATIMISSAGESFLDLDAGLIPSDPAIGDRVWRDSNRDGVQQVDEPGVASVTVRLLDDADNPVGSVMTDSDGLFSFLAIGSGTYRLEIVPPEDSGFTTPDAVKEEEIDSDFDPVTGRTDLFAYTRGTMRRDRDAGLIFLPIFADGFESGDTLEWSATIIP